MPFGIKNTKPPLLKSLSESAELARVVLYLMYTSFIVGKLKWRKIEFVGFVLTKISNNYRDIE